MKEILEKGKKIPNLSPYNVSAVIYCAGKRFSVRSIDQKEQLRMVENVALARRLRRDVNPGFKATLSLLTGDKETTLCDPGEVLNIPDGDKGGGGESAIGEGRRPELSEPDQNKDPDEGSGNIEESEEMLLKTCYYSTETRTLFKTGSATWKLSKDSFKSEPCVILYHAKQSPLF